MIIEDIQRKIKYVFLKKIHSGLQMLTSHQHCIANRKSWRKKSVTASSMISYVCVCVCVCQYAVTSIARRSNKQTIPLLWQFADRDNGAWYIFFPSLFKGKSQKMRMN